MKENQNKIYREKVIMRTEEFVIRTTIVLPFPRTTLSMIRRSMLLAATVSIQGATLDTVAPEGPLFPAACQVSIPLSIA